MTQKGPNSAFPVRPTGELPEHAERGTLSDAVLRQLLDGAPDGIVVVDSSGQIVAVNAQIEHLFGYGQQELIGQELELLVPSRLRNAHRTHRENYKSTPKTCTMGNGLELFGCRQDGSEFALEINLSPLRTPDGLLVIGIVRDVSQRKLASDQIKASLHEKELLLKEIHHRIKNNLQMISSLLRLQRSAIKDPAALAGCEDNQKRIRAMAVIHQVLCQANSVSRVDLREYVERLIMEIKLAYGTDSASVRFHVSIDPADASFDVTFRVGLILSELVSNCLKHAFPVHGGDITVQLVRPGPRQLKLVVADNGVGMKTPFDSRRDDTLGFQLVLSLVAQLGATIDVRNGAGTVVTVTFTNGD